LFTPESNEAGLVSSIFYRRDGHRLSARQASWIFAGVQRIEQEFLIAGHGVALSI
jgi:hypothetical protein